MGSGKEEDGGKAATSKLYDKLDIIMNKLDAIDAKVDKITEIETTVKSLDAKMSKLEPLVEEHQEKIKSMDSCLYDLCMDPGPVESRVVGWLLTARDVSSGRSVGCQLNNVKLLRRRGA